MVHVVVGQGLASAMAACGTRNVGPQQVGVGDERQRRLGLGAQVPVRAPPRSLARGGALVVVPTLARVVDGLPAAGKVRQLGWGGPVKLRLHRAQGRGAVPGGEKVDRQTPQSDRPGRESAGGGHQGGRRNNLSQNAYGIYTFLFMHILLML